MQISIESWTHTVQVKNLVLGNVGCYMWLLKEGVLQSLDVDGIASPCIATSWIHDARTIFFVLPCLALQVSATRSHRVTWFDMSRRCQCLSSVNALAPAHGDYFVSSTVLALCGATMFSRHQHLEIDFCMKVCLVIAVGSCSSYIYPLSLE